MKTRISQLTVALFFAIGLLSGNVNAADHNVKASSHENIEATLEFENWMLDEKVWNTATFHYTEATESSLEVENWMTSKMVWNVQTESLALEDWMMNDNFWEVKNIIAVETEKEHDLSMENWMMDEQLWNI